MGSLWSLKTFSIACKSLSLSHTASGAAAMAATRCLTVLLALAAIDIACRPDILADRFFAALRFLAMAVISSRPARYSWTSS